MTQKDFNFAECRMEETVYVERKTKNRYEVMVDNRLKNAHKHFVADNVMQIEVFHWYGATGKEKCDAVAKALNDLGHEKD